MEPDALEAAADSFACDDILKEILLKLPSPASLIRAALVYKRWGRIISSSDFISRYCKLYPSSPLLGIFFSDRPFGIPTFNLAGLVRSDADLKAVERRADLNLANLVEDSGWRIRDSRNGCLLLCRVGVSGGDSFSIYNPFSRRLDMIPEDRPHDQVDYLADCLLGDSLRVVSVQQYKGRIRAVEYDPGTLKWRFHQWQSPWASDGPNKLQSWGLEPMYAAGLIFWAYSAALALVLDCSSMEFSVCCIPVSSVGSAYAIGEIKDGVGCLVCLDNLTNKTTHGALKVWLLNTSSGDKTWEVSGEMVPVSKLLGTDTRVRKVLLVTNGLALLSWNDRHDQFVIDLMTRSLHAKFVLPGRAYPYQMAWPPVGLPSLKNICQEEAQPVQLVLPVEPAAPLHDAEVPVPIVDTGLAAPLDDVDLATRTNDVAYTEGPSDVGLKPMDVSGIEHIMAAEAGNLVGTAKDGMCLIETKAADTAAPSADLVEGMTHSSGAISREPRCEAPGAIGVPVESAPPLDDFDLAGRIDDVGCTEGPLDVGFKPLDLCATEHGMAAEADKLVGTVGNGVRLMETKAVEAAALSANLVEAAMTHSSEDISGKQGCEGLDVPDVDLAERVDDVACTEGPLDVDLRPIYLCGTEHVMAAEADNLAGTVKDGMPLMDTNASETTAPSANLVVEKTNSSEAISREQIFEEEVQLERRPEILPLLQMSTAQVFRSNDPSTVEQFMASKAENLVATADHMEQIMPATPENMPPKEKTEDRQDIMLNSHPSDMKLVQSYLIPRVLGDKSCKFIHEGDVYAAHPADLTRKYAAAVSSNGHQVWYFFVDVRTRGGHEYKARTVGGKGQWCARGKCEPVVSADVGYSRYLRFETREGRLQVLSGWLMTELNLHQHGWDELSLCKVYRSRKYTKNPKNPKIPVCKRKRKAAADTNVPGGASAAATVRTKRLCCKL